jgi:Tol biopolymer transport system component
MIFSKQWSTLLLLVILISSLQGCQGTNENSNSFQNRATNKNEYQIQINRAPQAKFIGKIYFTLNRNLYVLDSNLKLTQLTAGTDVRDPTVSPDGKWIAFIQRYKNYADLVYMSTNPQDQTIHTVVTGNGQYTPQSNGENTYYWFAQPAWSADSSHLLFLSDLQKNFYWNSLGGVYANAYFLDMQVFSLPIDVSLTAQQAIDQAQAIGYAVFGDGGNRDPSYRSGHPEQVMYTTFQYDPTSSKQVVQIVLEDTTLMTGAHRQQYHPGADPSVPLTPDTPNLVNFQPTFSPDGNTIAYVQRVNSTSTSIYTMPVAEGVTNDPNNPAFNPTDSANLQKALVPYSTKSVKLLTNYFVNQPVWSPDGKQLLYYNYYNNNFDIWLAMLNKDPKTGEVSMKPNSQVQLTQSNGQLDSDSRASWAP